MERENRDHNNCLHNRDVLWRINVLLLSQCLHHRLPASDHLPTIVIQKYDNHRKPILSTRLSGGVWADVCFVISLENHTETSFCDDQSRGWKGVPAHTQGRGQ